MKEKKLLIVERCNNNLDIIEEQLEGHSEKSIVLSGVFTTFDQKNRNGRIYESADFLPHVEALKEAIKHRTLLGEMDHPHSFETTLANASHVIESLEFDPAQNAVIGRIRLLNTSRGKDAQALVRDGIPLHISSRAAGTVNEAGKVRLQQLFTYDLVAEPGFANAVLTQVNEGVDSNSISDKSKNILIALNESRQPNLNESYGLNSEDDVEVYEVSEDVATNTNLQPKVAGEGQKVVDFGNEQANKTVDNTAETGTLADKNGFAKVPAQENTNNGDNKMDNGQYILYSDFQKYSEHLSEIITDLQNAISNYKTELNNMKKTDASAPTQAFDAEHVDNSIISDMIAQQVKAAIEKLPVSPAVPAACEGDECKETEVCPKCGKNPCECEKTDEVENAKSAMEEKYNNLEKYVKYLSEVLDKSITHQDYIAEEANKIIKHNNYLAENMNQMIEHQDYLAENINDTIGYQNYIAEMLDKSIDYSNMLAEEQNKTVAYNNYLSEKMNQMVEHQDYLAENLDKTIKHSDYLAENIEKITNGGVQINENNEEENKVEENNTVEEKKEVFNAKEYQNALSEKLNALIATVKTQYEEAKRLEAEAIEESKKASGEEKNFNLINYIPSRLNERWTKLSDERKKEILDESKMFVINSASSAEYFWNTRDLREKQIEVEKVDEQKTAQPAQSLNEDVLSDNRYKAMMEQIKSRMRRY